LHTISYYGGTMIVLKTKRLEIRDHTKDDLQPMNELLSHEAAMYYLDDLKTHTPEETRENLETAMNEINLEKRTKYFFAVVCRETGRYIGEIGFTVRLDTPMGKIVGLGYFILPEFWGRGIVTEAAKEVLRFAFEELNVIKVETGCIKDNQSSEKVMKKLGMVREAEYRMRVWHDNRLKDRVEYRLLKEEWERLQQ
jgi:[ribosomal protein S5]-alanine N-acetyltransferase